MIALFQTHSGMKHIYGDFCPAYAGISSVPSRIPPCVDRMKNTPASYKHTFRRKSLYAYQPIY